MGARRLARCATRVRPDASRSTRDATCQNHEMVCWRTAIGSLLLVISCAVLAPVVAGPVAAGASGVPQAALTTGSGPASRYDCSFNLPIDAFTGVDASASEIGWEGNHQGVVTCLGGTFLVEDGINKQFGFGIYGGTSTTWLDADGYLPAQITRFRYAGAAVTITEFADRTVIVGDPFEAVYSRVAVRNPTAHVIEANLNPTAGMVELNQASNEVRAHSSTVHDYVVAADRFGNQYPWPSAQALVDAGSFDRHYAHMKTFWNHQLAGIAEVDVPDPSLNDAYRSGFIYTQIARSGNDLNTGVNGYASEFSHDVVGILTNLFTQGYFTDAHALLLEAGDVVGGAGQYNDGIWTYAVPWAVYLMKTGDVKFIEKNFDFKGTTGGAQPSLEEAAHDIAADRTGPGGIMEETNDIDTNGYWTTDNFEALEGLAAYRYVAQRIGDLAEAQWAARQYDSLLAAVDTTLEGTIRRFGLNYLPCSMLQPNTANRCVHPEDANWASPFGNWAWEGYLLGATRTGPAYSMIDATYAYGFARLVGKLPPNTFGGFPDDYYSSGYNAAYGSAALAGQDFRDQGILSYQFMIAHSQSGPYSWWESSTAPATGTAWVGRHPSAGQGASPHAWGIAGANKVLLDSLVAQASNGGLIVGRGVPASWLRHGRSIAVTNFPTTDGRRLTLRISTRGRSVTLTMAGQRPAGEILFQLPSFVHNIAATSSGRVDQGTGTVAVAGSTRSVTVQRHRL
jgi:hypothetical protein